MLGTIININNQVAKYEIGHTKSKWNDLFGNDPDLWDFPISELLDGTIEPNPDIIYWLIGERLYETDRPSR